MLVEDGVVKLGPWMPDLPVYNNPGLVEAKNVIPVDGAYGNMLSLLPSGDALDERVQGAFATVEQSGSPELYAGAVDKLYELVGATWTDRSGITYSTATTGYWRYAQFGNVVIATNYNDAPQSRAIGSVDNFADLATGDAPKARQIGVINNFVVLGDIDDGSGALPSAVQWPAIGDPTNWPVPNTITARTVQAGRQLLNSAFGAVTGIAGGEFWGLVFQQRGINRFTYIGGDAVFQVQDIDRTRGCWAPQSLIQIGDGCYFLAVDGFYATNGQGAAVPIGNSILDKWFFSRFNQQYLERVTVSFDYVNKCVYWGFPTQSSSDGLPDAVVVYNIVEKRWAWGEQTIQMLFQSYTRSYTLEELDAIYASIDDIPLSLDSSIWQGGIPILMGFANNQLGTMVGAALPARFETGESEQNPFGLTFIRGLRPIVTGSPTSISMAIASRSHQDNEPRMFGSARGRTNRTGVCDFRLTGRFISTRLEVLGGFDRAIEIGVDMELSDQA